MRATRSSGRRARVRTALGVLAATLVATLAGPIEAGSAAGGRWRDPPVPASGAVVTEWNAIAFRTYLEAGVPIPVQALYGSFVSAAVHNAVVTIEGGYAPYRPQEPAAAGASVDAAAATAAYRMLATLVPASASSLAADHQRWVDAVQNPAARAAGVETGEEAAAVVLASRQDDGRDAPITLTTTPGPGVWDVPPGGMAVPWLGFVRPMVLPSPVSIPLSGPDPLTSRQYAIDLAEAKHFGVKTGSLRTSGMTRTAMFYSDNAVQQYNAGLSDRLSRHHAGAVVSARALALLNMSLADALITCWRAKYDFHNWRPQQAIQRADTDGNRLTVADREWEPLVPNPPYPDYTSGHACLSGAFSETLARLYGDNRIDVSIASSVTGTVRHYDSAAHLNGETKNARIWLGLHFRKAMDDGNFIGRQSATYVQQHALQRIR